MTQKEEIANNMLQEIAKEIRKKLPEGMGFALLAYELGNDTDDKKVLYISNTNRLDVMHVMTEFLQKNLDDPELFGKDKEDVSL